MLTVKEFKDFGSEFVVGDCVHSTTGVDGSTGEDLINNCATGVEHENFTKISNKLYACNDWTIESFAWRPLNSRPKNPAFSFEVDTEKQLWRPLLDQLSPSKPYDFDEHVSGNRVGVMSNGDEVELIAANDDKPVFTREMYSNGEQVKAGMLFSTATGNYTALIVSDEQVVFEHESLGFVVESHAFVHPVDLRTPKQKAVDELRVEILDFYGYGDDDGYQSLSEHLNELGYERSVRPTT